MSSDKILWVHKKQTLWHLFMDKAHLPKGYRATTRIEFLPLNPQKFPVLI